jgi:hypothetical protein
MVAISTRDDGMDRGPRLPDQRRLAHEPSTERLSGQSLEHGQLAQRLSMEGRVVIHSNSRYEMAIQRFRQRQYIYEQEANTISKPELHDAVFREEMKRIGRA